MHPALKTALKYLLSFGSAAAILWYLYRDKDMGLMFSGLLRAEPGLILLSVFLGLLSHWSRALRWNMLFHTVGYRPAASRTFMAVMVCYFVNLFTPKFGEVYRCVFLKKTEKIPVSISFGTVVSERAFDLLSSFALIVITFFMESGRLRSYIGDLLARKGNMFYALGTEYTFEIILGTVLFGIALLLILRKFRNAAFLLKIKEFIRKIFLGIFSLKNIKNKKVFLLHTVFIWAVYYYTTYLILQAYPPSSGLGYSAALSVFVIGTLGMTIPVQGGIAFIVFSSAALSLYGLENNTAEDTATLLYAMQVIPVFIVGGLSFPVSLLMNRTRKLPT